MLKSLLHVSNNLSIIIKVNFYTLLLFWAILYFHHYFLSS